MGSPSNDERAPPSARWPWLRSAAYSLVIALSPAAWVIETQSCAEEASRGPIERTGVALIQQMDVSEPLDQLIVGAIFAVMIAGPFLAWRARGRGARIAWHAASLGAAIFGLLATVLAMFFALFATRTLRPAGYLVLALTAAPVIESAVRVVLAIREGRAARRSPPRGSPPRGP